jgi:hypothetical protein
LVTSGYAPTLTESPSGSGRYYIPGTAWDTGANNASDPSYSEVSNGDGYTTGGITLTGASATNDIVDYADITWASLTMTFRGAVCVAIGTCGGIVDPVLWYMLPDSTPADIVSNGSDYSILWHATDGLFKRA